MTGNEPRSFESLCKIAEVERRGDMAVEFTPQGIVVLIQPTKTDKKTDKKTGKKTGRK